MSADERVARIVAARYDGDEHEMRQVMESTLRRLAYRRARGFRVCSTCGESKKPHEFAQNPTQPDGLAIRCKPCESGRQRSRRARTS